MVVLATTATLGRHWVAVYATAAGVDTSLVVTVAQTASPQAVWRAAHAVVTLDEAQRV